MTVGLCEYCNIAYSYILLLFLDYFRFSRWRHGDGFSRCELRAPTTSTGRP